MKSFWKYCEVVSLVMIGSLAFFHWFNGKLNFFVNPRYEYLILGSALALILVGLYRISDKSRCIVCCQSHAHHDHFLVPKKGIFFVLAIALVGIMVKPQPLSAQTAVHRGISLDFSTNTSETVYDFTLDPEKRSLIQWAKLFHINPEPDTYSGQAVEIDGFIMRPAFLSGDYFVIARFIIACCAADARPIGLLVHNTQGFEYEENTWIKLRGSVSEDIVDGQRQAVIELEDFEEIPVPSDPYEYKY